MREDEEGMWQSISITARRLHVLAVAAGGWGNSVAGAAAAGGAGNSAAGAAAAGGSGNSAAGAAVPRSSSPSLGRPSPDVPIVGGAGVLAATSDANLQVEQPWHIELRAVVTIVDETTSSP